jgi:peptidoglycan/LPS O-acetylase OafA/YrhL
MESTGYIKSLDGVRAIAIILVMSFHARLTEYGWIGVQLFFVLSGFLITGILWKEKSKAEPLLFKFKKFWVRRSLRIFPLYYGYLLIIGISYLLFHFPSYFAPFFPYLVSYTANFPLLLIHRIGNPLFNHLWSLSIEEQFYLLFPLIILLSPKRFTKVFLLAIIFLSPIVRFLVGEYYKSKGYPEIIVSNGVNFNTLCQLDAFCMGGIIPVLALDNRIKKPLIIFIGGIVIAAGAGGLNYLFSEPGTNYLVDLGYNHYLIGNYQHVWQYAALNLAFAAVLLALTSTHSRQYFSWLRAAMENRWMVRIGKVSYGMYIYHWLIWVYVFMGVFRAESYLSKALLFIPYVIVVYLLSELSYRIYEVRFIKLKDRFFPTSGGNKKDVSAKSMVLKTVSPANEP